jgi:hypothetical protein
VPARERRPLHGRLAAAACRSQPFIYGTNINDWGGARRGQRLGRLGGNRWTAYNWETNASNAGSDFQHQNDSFLGGGDTPGEAVRPHVMRAFDAGASMVVTVPIAGYVAPDKSPGGDVNRTPGLAERPLQRVAAGQGAGFPIPRTPATASSTRTSSWPGSSRR